jgi:hypothetical protein
VSDCPVWNEATYLFREAFIFSSVRPDLTGKLVSALLCGYMARANHALLCDGCIDREVRAILGSTPAEQK